MKMLLIAATLVVAMSGARAGEVRFALSEIQAPQPVYEVVIFLDKCDPDANDRKGCIEQFATKVLQELERANHFFLSPEPLGKTPLETFRKQELKLPVQRTPSETLLAFTKK